MLRLPLCNQLNSHQTFFWASFRVLELIALQRFTGKILERIFFDLSNLADRSSKSERSFYRRDHYLGGCERNTSVG
jgi:hypothetical protein